MELILKLAPIIISIAALCLSIRSFNNQIPHLKVAIKQPQYDCYYGASAVREHDGAYYLSRYIAVIRFTLKNTSGVPMTVSRIELVYNGISYDLIDADNSYWSEIEIFFPDVHNFGETEHGYTTDGTYLDYGANGVRVPAIIEPYGTKDVVAAFVYFPKLSAKTVTAKLHIETARRTLRKKVKLLHCDETFKSADFEDFDKFINSY